MNRLLNSKIKSFSEIASICRELKSAGKKIVYCHGTFDLVHPGHIRHFHSAKAHGDVLIVSLTADRFVKKGPGRPIFNEKLRAEVLASLAIIDYVLIIPYESAIEAIQKIQPHFYVKGPDYKNRKPNPLLPRKLGIEEMTVKKYGGQLIFTDDNVVFSSSHLINAYLESYPETTQVYLEKMRQKYSDSQIIDCLCTLKNKRVLVIGDTIIDEYCYTKPMGKSSKEPLVVHNFQNKETYAGGTLATANHLAALSDNVYLATLLGRQESYLSFIKKHLRPQIKANFFYQENTNTIVDRRYLDILTKQKLFQIRFMRDELLDSVVEKKVRKYLTKILKNIDLVVVNDFGHGFLSPRTIRLLCKKAKFLALNVQANSANYGFNVVTKYPRADFICMDEYELRLATHDKHGELYQLMKKIAKKMHSQELIITRGSNGSVGYNKDRGFIESPALSQNVVDRVGAGDAFFAISSPCVYQGMDRNLVSFIGNVAGALKVQTVGNKFPIEFSDLTKFITRLLK